MKGWCNEETWNLVNYIDNDRRAYMEVRDIIREGIRRGYTKTDVSENLHDWLLDKMLEVDFRMFPFFRDAIEFSMRKVDFIEIAHEKMIEMIEDELNKD